MQPLKTRGSMRVNMMLTSVLTRLSHARVNMMLTSVLTRLSYARSHVFEVCRSFRVNKRVNMKACHHIANIVASSYRATKGPKGI